MSANNYGEIFCQAAEILAQHLIEKVSYDQTILCTIMDDSEKDSGKYRVSSGEAIFDAYTSDTSLRKNHQVYVSIPSGDWNEQKLIIAKKTTDSNEPVTYKDPFDSFINITNNLITSNIDSKGLVANDSQEGEKHRYITLWTYNRPDITNALSKNSGEVLGGYTRLAISADFKAWLKSLNAVKGDYGLQLQIETEPEDSADGSQAKTETKYCIFSSKQMIGNPFNFESFYNQKRIFDISGLKNIKSMVLYFYQEPGSFINGKGELIPSENRPANIFVKDVVISLGYDTESFEDDSLIIYTLNSQKYDVKKSPLSDNHKELHVRWVHKFDDGKIKVVQPEDEINYQLNWYRQELGARSHTVWSGVDWTPLSSQISKDGNIEYTILDSFWIEYNKTASTITDDPIRKLSYNQSWLLPDTTLAEEKIKVVLTYGSEVIYSNILTFSNVDEVVSKATMDAIQALSVKCEDDSFGNYLIYDLGGNILDNAESRKIREFRAYFNSAQDAIDDDELAQLTEANTIEWIIPTKNTMIEVEDYISGNIERNYIDENGYYHIFRFGANKYDPEKNSVTSGDANITNQNSQRYKINSHYDNSKTDNTIKCVVTKNGVQYTTIKELTFGPAGTSGTNYSFVIDFISNDSALTLKSDFADGEAIPAVIARARLYDYTGKEIPNLEVRNIEWSIGTVPFNKQDEIVDTNDFIKIIPFIGERNKVEIQLLDTVISIPENNYTVLKAVLRKSTSTGDGGWGDYDLYAYLPIPIRSSRKYKYISGATTIFYNSLGEIDSFYQNPYLIYCQDKDDLSLTTPESKWAIYSDSENDPYSPKMSSGIDGYKLIPINMYVKDSMDNLCIVGSIGENKIWSQPIFVTQNKYPSSIINEWNGELTIDKDKNAILAAKIAAGKKNKDDNTFSGVIMGDWEGDDGRSSAEKPITENTGIYGFQHGIASFGFRDDGTAFIGKPGKGRLEFDGNKSIIQSNSFASKKGGLSLDFDKGLIEVYEPDKAHNSNKSIIINAAATSNPFKIGDFFKVNWDGTLDATNGIFSGKITSDEGEIGGWEIGENTLKSQSGNVILDSNDDSIEGAILRTPSGGMILEGYLTVRDKDDNSGIGTYLGYMRSGGQNTNANLASDGIGMRVDSGNIGSQIKATTNNAGLSYTNGSSGGWLTMDSNGFSVGTNKTSIIAGDSLARLSSNTKTAVSVHYTESGIDPDGTNWNTLRYENGIEITLDKNKKPVITFCADKDNQHGIYARFA